MPSSSAISLAPSSSPHTRLKWDNLNQIDGLLHFHLSINGYLPLKMNEPLLCILVVRPIDYSIGTNGGFPNHLPFLLKPFTFWQWFIDNKGNLTKSMAIVQDKFTKYTKCLEETGLFQHNFASICANVYCIYANISNQIIHRGSGKYKRLSQRISFRTGSKF